MILRIDRLATELPPPTTPDPDGAAAVQELMGGRFGEMPEGVPPNDASGSSARSRTS